MDKGVVPELLTRKELAGLLGCDVRTVDRHVAAGLLPRPIRFSPKFFRWRRSDVEKCFDKLSTGG